MFIFLNVNSVLLMSQKSENEEIVELPSQRNQVKELFKHLTKNYGYEFTYSANFLNEQEWIVTRQKNVPIHILFKEICERCNVAYKRRGKNVIFYVRNKVTISGVVTDSESGETLLSANVFNAKTYHGTITNDYGHYVLHVANGEVTIGCSYIGYKPCQLKLNIDKDTVINLLMEPNLHIKEVVVIDQGPQKTVQSPLMSQVEMKVADIKNSPALLGEVDIIKIFQLKPGVQSGTEGSSGFFVRGGAMDQNLVLLDGVSMYGINHLFGFFSVFNAGAIKRATLIKGGFPARYGGRLSSVVDVRMKDGNMKEFHGEGSIGVISTKFTLEGPVVKDKTSFLISGRRTYYDAISKPFQNLVEGESVEGDILNVGAYFYDLNLKVAHKFSEKDRLIASVYFGKDKFRLRDETNQGIQIGDGYSIDNSGVLSWGNFITALRWNHKFSHRLFGNLTTFFSDYTLRAGVKSDYIKGHSSLSGYSYFNGKYYSRVRDYGVKYDFDFPVSEKHFFRFGASNTYHLFSPGVGNFKEETNAGTWDFDTSFGRKNIPANELFLYVEDDIKLTSQLKVNVGIHSSMFNVEGGTYFSAEPRISGRYLVTPDLSLKASYVHMTQYLNLLASSSVGLPTDLWVPSSKKIKPQESWQIASGVAYNIRDKYMMTLEGYYKKMTNLCEYKEGAEIFTMGADDIDKLTIQGNGQSYGAEFMIEKSSGKLTGWLSYTLSWSNRAFPEVSNGKTYPFKFDRRHNLAIVANYNLSERINIGVNWVYYTGTAFTLVTEEAEYISSIGEQSFRYENMAYNSSVNTVGYFNTRNNYRMPDYHRLDIGVNLKKKLKRAERTWSFGAYNAYNRKNPFLLTYSREYSIAQQKAVPTIKQVTLLPVIPYVRYTIKF